MAQLTRRSVNSEVLVVAAYTQPRCCQENVPFLAWDSVQGRRIRHNGGLVAAWASTGRLLAVLAGNPYYLSNSRSSLSKSAMSSLMRRAVSGSVAICRASLRYLIIAASGPALGSWLAAALVVIFSLPFLLYRAITEDRILQVELAGYSDYAARVRWRLVPGIW